MTYATSQNLIDRFGQKEIQQLTDRSNAGAIDTNVLAQALADTDAEINSYLEPLFNLPLVTVPLILTRVASDIARYYLYDVRATDLVKARYKDAVMFLQNVANGTVSIGVDSNNQPQAMAGGIKFIGTDRVFSKTTLGDY